MEFNPVVFDISSDEEPAFDELRGGDDDHEWLTGLLQTVGKEITDAGTDGDDDDVVVVGDYVPPKSKSKPLKVVKGVDDDDDDDDCVVLDGDPDKAVKVADEVADDGDEVLVVGETGQIACRDYPHSRHLCAKFPFSSTPHEQHCNLCHCYVCDSLAPCPHWGNGISTTDHCHATDKQDMWKFQRRESFRLKNNPLPVPKFPEARLPNPIAPSQLNSVPAINKQMAPISRHNEVYRPTVTNAYSSARMTIPNIISQSRNPRHGFMTARNRLGPCSVSQQALGVRGNAVLQNRGQQLAYRTPTFKRHGLVRSALTKNQQPVYSSSNTNYAPPPRYVAATNPSWQHQNGLPNPVSGPFVHPSPAQPVTSALQPELHSVPIASSNNNQNAFQPVPVNVVDSSFSDFEFWLNNLDQSIQQASAENTQPQPQPQPQPIPSINEPAAANPINSQLGGSFEPLKDNDVESWLLNQSEGLAADLNIFSPVPTAYDAGQFDSSKRYGMIKRRALADNQYRWANKRRVQREGKRG